MLMNTVRSFYSLFRVIIVALVVSATTVALVFPKSTWAAVDNTKICNPGNTCVIGEFLYDDSYDPLTTATCVLNSRYPNGTAFLTSQSAPVSSEGDAWYSYQFTTPATIGTYRTEIRCTTVEGDIMALDKSFQVKAESSSAPSADDVAAATWSYSNRTLSSFGSLIADIWNSATRTLTGAGLSSGSIATKSDVESVSTKVDGVSTKVDGLNTSVTDLRRDSVTTIEKFVNGPIIEYLLENGDDDDSPFELQVKIEQTQAYANQLTSYTQYLKSKVSLVDKKWSNYKIEQILSTISGLESVLGDKNAKNNSSIIGSALWVNNQWGWDESNSIVSQSESIKLSLAKFSNNLEYNGKSTVVYADLKKINSQIDKLQKTVGGIKSESLGNNLYSKINETAALAKALDSVQKDMSTLFLTWNPNSKNLEKTVDLLSKEILSLSVLPKSSTALTPVVTSFDKDRGLRNKVLGLIGIIKANRQYLIEKPSDGFVSTWMELGSIVFKTIITNPSGTVDQTVPLRYDLPPEIKREDILEVDEGLEIKFDSEKNNYYISGLFELSPNESKTLSVVADDKVFEISEDEIETLKKQAEQLSLPLEGTSYYAQGVTLKSDIDVSLDKILRLKDNATLPEDKIRVYREAQTELEAVKGKIEKLKDLVTTAGSVGTMFGFVGGAQTLAVWGMIIIMVAGFVFLALYMRQIRLHDAASLQKGQVASMNVGQDSIDSAQKKKKEEIEEDKKSTFNLDDDEKPKKRFSRSIRAGVIIIGSFGIMGGLVAGISMFTNNSNSAKEVVEEQEDTSEKVLGTTEEVKEEKGEDITIFVPEDAAVTIHKEPSFISKTLVSLNSSQKAQKVDEDENWVKVSFEYYGEEISGWVDSDFLEAFEEDETEDLTQKKSKKQEVEAGEVVVDPELIGFLRVRDVAKNGKIIYEAKAGEEFSYVDEEDGWIQVELSDGTLGWLSAEYVTVNP